MSVLQIIKRLELAVLTILGVAMTVVMIANVIMRYLFESSIIWAEEFVRIGFVWAMFIAITAGFIRREHIGFDALMRKTRWTARLQDIFYGVALVIVGGLMAWFGNIYNGYTGSVELAGTGLPTSVLLWPGILAGAAWVVIGLVNIGRGAYRLRSEKE